MKERYRLTFTHDVIVDGYIVEKVEEPKVYEFYNADMNNLYNFGFRNYALDVIFGHLLEELKEASE